VRGDFKASQLRGLARKTKDGPHSANGACRLVPGDAAGALVKAVLQQSSSIPLVPVQHFDADQRQVPMRLGWPVMLGHLEDVDNIDLFLASNAFCKDRLERTLVTANARRKPKRDTMAVAGVLRRPCFKRACSEGSEQSRDVQQIIMRVVIHPSRDRIRAKSQNEGGDGTIDFAGAGSW
jgi:hypothetical protein